MKLGKHDGSIERTDQARLTSFQGDKLVNKGNATVCLGSILS